MEAGSASVLLADAAPASSLKLFFLEESRIGLVFIVFSKRRKATPCRSFQDNRLQSGDHILQIGDVNLRGMGSEQVAAVLRQSGTHVRLVVARPVEPTSPDYKV